MITMKEMSRVGSAYYKDCPLEDPDDSSRSIYLAGFRAGALWAQDFILEKLNSK